MILTARIAKTGIRRLRDEIYRRTGVKILYSSRVTDLSNDNHVLHFRYGFSLPLPPHLRHLETTRNSPEDIIFLKDKKRVADHVLAFGMLAPLFINYRVPNEDEYPVIVREMLDSFGGRGMHIVRNAEEFMAIWRPNYYWCAYIPTDREFRFHIGNGSQGIQIIRCMEKVGREEETKNKDVHIRHVDEYHYSKRYDPYDKYPRWCSELTALAETLPGWLYSFDVGVTPEKRLVIFETNTASGIDNGCARDYADFILNEGIL